MRDAPSIVDPDGAVELARFATGLGGGDLPADLAAITRRFVLDAIGVAIAGSTAPGSAETLALYARWGGRPEATVLMGGTRLPAPHAALVNGFMLHARDFDDTHDVAIVHAYASVLPSVLAAAEEAGGVDGRALQVAIVVGVELACRLGLALRHYHGWHNSAVCGTFAAAASAGRILGLTESQMRHALGIAFSQAAGNVQCIRDGALTKRMQLGFAAQAGVSAAYLARAGITGTTRTFDGPYGFLRLYDHDADPADGAVRLRDDGGAYGRHELVEGLGRRFEAARLSMKPYPNSRAVHPAIAGALALLAGMSLSGAEIERVLVSVSERTYERVVAPYPPGAPLKQVDAQFNLRYGVAVALCRGGVGLLDFEPERLGDPEVLALMRRVDVERDAGFHENLPVRIVITTRDGRRGEQLVTRLEGAPDAPMSDELRESKFRRCCELAARPMPASDVDAVIAAVGALDRLRDVRALTALVA